MVSWSLNSSPHSSRGHLNFSHAAIRMDLFRLTAAQTMNLCRAQSSPAVVRDTQETDALGLASECKLDFDRLRMFNEVPVRTVMLRVDGTSQSRNELPVGTEAPASTFLFGSIVTGNKN